MDRSLELLVFFSVLVALIQSADYNFTLIEPGLPWPEAQTYCRSKHIDLADIRNADDTAEIQKLFVRHQLNSSAWIGLHSDFLSWRWSVDGSLLGNFSFWESREPNNNGGNQLCVAMYSDGWWDAQCWHRFHALCYDKMKTGMNRYVLITNNLTWTQAQTLCRTNYTDLMSIQDQTEYDAVVNQTSADTWIGLHRHGWYWTNTTNTFPIDWAYDQPDNYNWDENCGAFLDGLASDESCTAIKPFVCSAYPRTRQMIQLKLESHLDVNDPAVKAATLKMIEQKLILLRVPEIIKLAWKQHEDGGVFKKLG